MNFKKLNNKMYYFTFLCILIQILLYSCSIFFSKNIVLDSEINISNSSEFGLLLLEEASESEIY